MRNGGDVRAADSFTAQKRFLNQTLHGSHRDLQFILQRQFESFPFFEFFEAAFTMGLIGLVIAQLMIAHEFQNVLHFPFRIGQSPFD